MSRRPLGVRRRSSRSGKSGEIPALTRNGVPQGKPDDRPRTTACSQHAVLVPTAARRG